MFNYGIKMASSKNMKNQSDNGFWKGFNTTALLLTFCFLFFAPLLQAFVDFRESVDLSLIQEVPSQVFVATDITVTLTNASSTPLNAVEFEIHYNPKALQVTKITPHHTLCEEQFVIESTINNASGTVSFACGTITPFTGIKGTVATLQITPLTSGTSTLTFSTTTTHVLAYDGYGTDATKGRQNLILRTIQ